MNIKLKLSLAACCLLKSIIGIGQTSFKSYPIDAAGHFREYSVDMEKMVLDVKFRPEKGEVVGSVTYTFSPTRKTVDSLFLDAPAIRFKKVMLDGKECRYNTGPLGITLYFSPALNWNSKHNLAMDYEATPKKGLYFIGWDDPAGKSRKQIWTQGEGIDNRYWIPGYDDPTDKLLTEEIVTIDKKYKVLGNGTKIWEKENKDGTKTWHYRMMHPHAFYLVMLGIGEYEIASSKSPSGVPLNNWYYPDQPQKLEPTYRYTGQIMDFLEKETGVAYPWESYSQIPVQNFLYGAMENTTATIFGDFFCVDKREYLDKNYVGVNAHEMAHQWFGDLITARSGKDMWLQESFATHYSKLADRKLFGDDSYNWNRHNEANAALNASKDNRNPIGSTMAGTARIYQKGSFVLDMLKYVVGKEEYDKVITYYLKKHAYGTVETYDLYIAFHDVLGRNLDWFFDEWIYRGGEPEYNISYREDMEERATVVEVAQVQERNEVVGLFKMPITVEVHYKDGSMASKQEMVETEHHSFRIPNTSNKQVDYVLFDPNDNILKKVSFSRTFEVLEAQALKAPNMLDRYSAIAALKSYPVARKRNSLIQAYNKETFHALKTEVISQLANDEDPASNSLLNSAIADRDVKVRLSAIQNMSTIPVVFLPGVEKLLTDSSYKIIETTLNKLCNLYPQNTYQYLKATDKQFGPDNGLRISWLKLRYLYETEKKTHIANDAPMPPEAMEAVNELEAFASPSFEFRTRINAMQAMQALNYIDDKGIASLLDAYLSKNSRLSGPASSVISSFNTQEEQKRKLSRYVHSHQWEGADKESISKVVQ
jgi:aminopeptidase N